MATIKELLLDVQNRSRSQPLNAQELKDSSEAVLAELVAMNTSLGFHAHESYGQPIEATKQVAEALEALGVKVIMDEPHEAPPGTGIMHRNLVAIVGEPNPAQPVVTWSGHIDTVGAKKEWPQGSPFEMHREPIGKDGDEKLIGRGIFDMKGSVAPMLVAIAANADRLKDSGKSMAFMLSSGEELGFIGVDSSARMMKENNITPSEIIVGEPTENYIFYGIKGGVQRDITLEAPARDAGERHKHRFEVTIANSSPQYAAFMAGKISHPLNTAMRLHQGIRTLQKEGIDVEITSVKMGDDAITPPGDVKLEISYTGSGEDRVAIRQKINDIAQPTQLSQAKGYLARKVVKRITGAEPGSLECAIEHEDGPSGRACRRHGEDNCAEASLEYARHYLKHSNSANAHFRGAPKDTGYPKPFMDKAEAITNFMHADTEKADIRPILLKTPGLKMEDVMTNFERIEEEVRGQFPGTTLTAKEYLTTEPVVQDPNDPIFGQYIALAKQAGVPLNSDKPVKFPYACDANELIKRYPDTPVVFFGAGGIGNGAHSQGEHIKASELGQNARFWNAALTNRVLGEPVRGPSAEAGAAVAL